MSKSIMIVGGGQIGTARLAASLLTGNKTVVIPPDQPVVKERLAHVLEFRSPEIPLIPWPYPQSGQEKRRERRRKERKASKLITFKSK